jgi:hypothetical protein
MRLSGRNIPSFIYKNPPPYGRLQSAPAKIEETVRDKIIKEAGKKSIDQRLWDAWRKSLDDYAATRIDFVRQHMKGYKQFRLARHKPDPSPNLVSDPFFDNLQKVESDPGSFFAFSEIYLYRFSPINGRLAKNEMAEFTKLKTKSGQANRYETEIFNRMKTFFKLNHYDVDPRCTRNPCPALDQRAGKIIDNNGYWAIKKTMENQLAQKQLDASYDYALYFLKPNIKQRL